MRGIDALEVPAPREELLGLILGDVSPRYVAARKEAWLARGCDSVRRGRDRWVQQNGAQLNVTSALA